MVIMGEARVQEAHRRVEGCEGRIRSEDIWHEVEQGVEGETGEDGRQKTEMVRWEEKKFCKRENNV